MYSTCAKINYIINSCVVNGAINCLEYPVLVTGLLDAALHKDTVKAHKKRVKWYIGKHKVQVVDFSSLPGQLSNVCGPSSGCILYRAADARFSCNV